MSEKTYPVPEGYRPLTRPGPFLDQFGPLYVKRKGPRELVVAMRIEHKHLNIRGIAHGGVLVALADSALGISLSYSQEPKLPMVTVNLTTDFVDSAKAGDWLEAHTDIHRVGARLAFANCFLHVGKRRILRASGVFAIMPPVTDQPGDEAFEG